MNKKQMSYSAFCEKPSTGLAINALRKSIRCSSFYALCSAPRQCLVEFSFKL